MLSFLILKEDVRSTFFDNSDEIFFLSFSFNERKQPVKVFSTVHGLAFLTSISFSKHDSHREREREFSFHLIRTSTIDEEYLSSDRELLSYINEYFWPRIQACTIRVIYSLRDVTREYKPIERHWILHVREISFIHSFRILFFVVNVI